MKRAIRHILFFITILFFIAALANVAVSGIDQVKKNETFKELELFADALAFVQTQYVDQTQPKDLIYGAMAGMLSGLDAHSQFMSPEEYEDLKVDTEGKFGGVGIEITVKDGLITVITALEGTPAWEAGMKPNDRIVKIDDVLIKDFTLNEAVKLLRGEPGTEVKVVVWREKESRLYSFDIKRAIIEIKDIKEARLLEDNIAYIKLIEFREDTPRQLDLSLEDLKGKGMESLIFDLRNNPGGLLDKATEVAGRFLPKGSLIVTIKGRGKKQNGDFKSTFRSPLLGMPIILLVNEGSASGSEIVAGAFQDHKRGIVLGGKTFGKGSVQTVLPLKDGSALKLTTSRYYTPLGRTIQDTGIMPDILVEQKRTVEEEEKKEKKDLRAIFEKLQEKKIEDEEDGALTELYALDNQLSRAVDLLKSIKVYENIINSSSKNSPAS